MNSLFEWLAEVARTIQLWVVVLPWERAVRVRMGNHSKVLEPGMHLKLPIIDKIWPVNNRLRFAAFPAQTLTTLDGKTMTVGGTVGFRISDPLQAMLSMQQPEYSCAALIQSCVSSYIASRTADELDKAELETEAAEQLRRAAPGFVFEFVTVSDWASVRAIRLLQETWRPETRPDHDPYAK